jgi:hypothetical protein
VAGVFESEHRARVRLVCHFLSPCNVIWNGAFCFEIKPTMPLTSVKGCSQKNLQDRVPHTCLPCLFVCVYVCVCVFGFSCLPSTDRAAISLHMQSAFHSGVTRYTTHTSRIHAWQERRDMPRTCQVNVADSHVFSRASWHAWIHNMQRFFTCIHG